MKTATSCFFVIVVILAQARAQEWTRFRGPNGAGISDAKTIPTQWTEKDINWKVELPGLGHSSPVLWGEKIFVTSCDDKSGTFYVLSYNAGDGSKRWQKEFPLTPFRKHNYNTLASATPAVDAERIYVSRVDREHNVLLAMDHDGRKVWEYDLGPFQAQHGSGVSPIVYEGKVVIPNEQDGQSYLLALDARTGELRWKTPRQSKQSSAAYSTPCVYQPKGGKPELIFNSEVHGISAFAPDTGKVVWEFPAAFDKRSVSSPVLAGDLIIGSCGSGGGGNFVVAVRPGDAAKKPERAYEVRKSAPYVPTSVCVGDWLYLWSDGGIVSRVRAATGEVQWQERAGEKLNFFSSPLCVNGRLFNISTSGEVVVIATSEKFEVLGRYPLNETTHSTPAISGGRMFIHTTGHLLSVGGAKPTP
jgi:outer membrane protein assembly factor BamB